tara:strand:+ start:186 stop:353 length:168 start_codon:yes stop_codon:yes gene_type:complete
MTKVLRSQIGRSGEVESGFKKSVEIPVIAHKKRQKTTDPENGFKKNLDTGANPGI